jgi:hypothetical protein
MIISFQDCLYVMQIDSHYRYDNFFFNRGLQILGKYKLCIVRYVQLLLMMHIQLSA